ncbi:putative beta-glucosidase [Fusarium oxysporum f. sp. phaseoli]
MPSLPKDFQLGFATASYQIEGAVAEDGRGPSIWDVFCHLEPTRTKGANGDVACDHYHRLEEDLDLLKRYGSDMYRFSISWSRVIPLGGRDDPVNEAGIAFYDRVIDGCLKRGITPWVTLYHWDLPQRLHERYGGWLDVQESQKDFERYARLCYERFGDRVKHWITLNEPWIVSIFGYATGGNAPGRSSINPQSTEGDTSTEPWIVGKALIMSHARAVAAYNQDFRESQKGQIGISLNGDYYEPWDSSDPRDSEAAERRMQFHIGWFANPIFLGQDYPKCMRDQLKDRLPQFTSDELNLLRSAESDFYGMNYYTSQFARHKSSPAPDADYIGNLDELQTNKAGDPVGLESGLHWLRSCPDLFRKHLTRVYRLYGKPIIVTENGCPCPGEDKMAREESVQDEYRIKYFEDHLDAIGRSVGEDGSVVEGYFAWSLMDNLEWSDGYGPRFGVTFTDYETLERTPKKSALVLRHVVDHRKGKDRDQIEPTWYIKILKTPAIQHKANIEDRFPYLCISLSNAEVALQGGFKNDAKSKSGYGIPAVDVFAARSSVPSFKEFSRILIDIYLQIDKKTHELFAQKLDSLSIHFIKMVRILITGSADGLGLEAARQLVKRNHTVYLHARNAQRAAEAKANCPGAAGAFAADLTLVSETKRLAEEVNAVGTFDAIIHNAGMMAGPFRKTPDTGIPAQTAVNVLAPYILTCLLTPPKRLIYIASQLHAEADTSVKDIFWLERGDSQFQDFPAYCDSKLHVMLLANAVARRFSNTSVVSVHPGWVATKLGGEDGPDKLEDGVDTYVMLAEGDYDQSLTGRYFEPKRKLAEPTPQCSEVELQERVVDACERLVGLKLPGI